MSTLNLPLIAERVSSTHRHFIKEVGNIPEKITADHQFLVKRMSTRIDAIVKCFIRAEVVDTVVQGYFIGAEVVDIVVQGYDRACYCFKLSKRGYDKVVYVYTDGVNINIKTASYPYMSGLNFVEDEVIRNVDFDSYNWVEFVDKLMHFIHKVIYARMESYNTKIFERQTND